MNCGGEEGLGFQVADVVVEVIVEFDVKTFDVLERRYDLLQVMVLEKVF